MTLLAWLVIAAIPVSWLVCEVWAWIERGADRRIAHAFDEAGVRYGPRERDGVIEPRWDERTAS